MNKENKTLNLALRICIILTWVMSNVSLFVFFSGLANIESEGLDEKNFPERLFKIIGDFADKVTLYYVVLGLVAVCLVLSVLTRYKTRMHSFIVKIIFLAISLVSMISGLEYINALGNCKGLSNLTYSGFTADSVASALTSAGCSGDVQNIAQTLTDKEAAANAIGGYIFPIFILFILTITSIHCLVKRHDPNNKNSEEN